MKHHSIYRIIRLPILSVALFSGLMVYSAFTINVASFSFEWQTSGAVFLFVLGVFVIAIAGKLFRKMHTTVNPLTPEKTTKLVTSGLYQYSRNPMYVGFLLWLLAVFIWAGSGLNVIFIIGYIWVANRFYILPEERALEGLFGAEYLAYQQSVRRWI